MKQFRFMDYVDVVEEGTLYSRSDLAAAFGVGGSTARYHLERAVKEGELNKQYGWLGRQSGWLYGTPTTIPRLEGM